MIFTLSVQINKTIVYILKIICHTLFPEARLVFQAVTTRWCTHHIIWYFSSIDLDCVQISYRPVEGCVRVQRAPGWGRAVWAVRSALPHPEEPAPETHLEPPAHDPASANPTHSLPGHTTPQKNTDYYRLQHIMLPAFELNISLKIANDTRLWYLCEYYFMMYYSYKVHCSHYKWVSSVKKNSKRK